MKMPSLARKSQELTLVIYSWNKKWQRLKTAGENIVKDDGDG